VVVESGGGGGKCEIKDKNNFANLVPESIVICHVDLKAVK
jgi:hypothetical protein